MDNLTIVKGLVLGSSRVGKTQLINRFVNGKFNEESGTEFGSSMNIKQVQYKGQSYQLQILEASQIDKESNISALVKEIEVFIFVFDLTSLQSYDFVSEIIEAVAQNKELSHDAVAIVLGNKADLSERVISYEEGSILGKKVGKYVEFSAKTGQNVEQVCEQLWCLQRMLKVYKNGQFYPTYKSISKSDSPLDKQQLESKLFYQALQKISSHQSKQGSPIGVRKSQLEDQKTHLAVRALLVGQTNCGKSSIAHVFAGDGFPSTFFPTLGVDFFLKTVEWRNVFFKLQLWDTAGINSYRKLIKVYYKLGDTVLLVYDITNQNTFQTIQNFYNDILIQSQKPQKVKFVLIGNKCDLQGERKVSRQMGEELSANIGCPFFEISAKTSKGVDQCILSTIENYLLQKFKQ